MSKAALILWNKSKDKVLIAKATLTKGPRNFDFPKGTIEEGETPFDCIKRECQEEIGFVPEDITHFHMATYGKGDIDYFIAHATETDEEVLQKCVCTSTFQRYGKDWPELQDFQWCTLEEALKTKLWPKHEIALTGVNL